MVVLTLSCITVKLYDASYWQVVFEITIFILIEILHVVENVAIYNFEK